MRHFRLLLLSGFAIDIPAFLILFLFAFTTISHQGTITLAPGTGSYGSIEVDLQGGSPISGTFESVSGNDVLFMLLDEDQYQDYKSSLPHSSRFSTVGHSGSFSIEQVDMERCYLVVEHATEFSSTEEIRVTYEFTGTDYVYFSISAVLFLVGAVIVLTAFYLRNKEKIDAKASSTKYLDVVFFENDLKK